jgi:hypothetical protein
MCGGGDGRGPASRNDRQQQFSGSAAPDKERIVSTTLTTRPQIHARHPVARLHARFRHITRRDLQVALGVLWLLDGALQAQPFMYTGGFATQVIAPVGQGQPGFVSGPVNFAAAIVAAHPFAVNLAFAAIQLLLGIGLLVRRTARVSLIASIGWALGVWYLGEGLSGLASGHASLLSGAPGSALLYAILAVAAWPKGDSDRPPARWLIAAWTLLWVGAAIFQLLPGQNSGDAVAGVLTASAGQAPHWLAQLDTSVATWASQHGVLAVLGLAAVELLIGVAALPRVTRTWALRAGLVLSIAIWVIGQDLGQLYSGQATDPNSAPLFVMMAAALLAVGERPVRRRRLAADASATP